MKQQIEDVVYKKHDAIPYPEYIKHLVLSGKMELTEARQHTRDYLRSYNIGDARPPVHYYRKVGAKDDIKSLLSEDNYKKYQECVSNKLSAIVRSNISYSSLSVSMYLLLILFLPGTMRRNRFNLDSF